jgi:hypothetical protein
VSQTKVRVSQTKVSVSQVLVRVSRTLMRMSSPKILLVWVEVPGSLGVPRASQGSRAAMRGAGRAADELIA